MLRFLSKIFFNNSGSFVLRAFSERTIERLKLQLTKCFTSLLLEINGTDFNEPGKKVYFCLENLSCVYEMILKCFLNSVSVVKMTQTKNKGEQIIFKNFCKCVYFHKNNPIIHLIYVIFIKVGHFPRLNLSRSFRNKFSCCFCLIETFLVEEVFNASDLLRDDDVARHVDEGEVAGFVEVRPVDFKQQ